MIVKVQTSRRIVCSSSRYSRPPHRLSWDVHRARGQAAAGPQPQALGGPDLGMGIGQLDLSYRVWTPAKCCQYKTRHTCTRLVKLFIKLLASIFHSALLSTRTVYWCASFVPAVQLQPARHRAPLPPPPRPRPRPAADISKLFPHSLIFANQKICHLFNYSNKRELESLG